MIQPNRSTKRELHKAPGKAIIVLTKRVLWWPPTPTQHPCLPTLNTWVVSSLPVEHEKHLWECALHGKDPPGGSGEEACRRCGVHKSCHRSECQGGARSLFWQQTKASIPTNLLGEKIGTAWALARTVFPARNLLISSPPQLCACPVWSFVVCFSLLF